MSNRVLTWSLLAAFAVLFGIAAGMVLLHTDARPIRSGTLLERPRPVPDFALTGSDGKPFTKADLLGHWDVVYVGYTHCPDVCPTTLALLKAVAAGLGDDRKRLRVVFLSIDPERDTPETLAQYTHYFNPDFLAATGSNEQLDALGSKLGFVYQKVPGETPQSYLMDHSSALILIDPKGEVAGYLTPPFKTEDLVGDLKQLVERTA
ncbi:MAG: SCO family protein [Nevskia sp.]|nr:SCO family protein [Nevskia sp.]